MLAMFISENNQVPTYVYNLNMCVSFSAVIYLSIYIYMCDLSISICVVDWFTKAYKIDFLNNTLNYIYSSQQISLYMY